MNPAFRNPPDHHLRNSPRTEVSPRTHRSSRVTTPAVVVAGHEGAGRHGAGTAGLGGSGTGEGADHRCTENSDHARTGRLHEFSQTPEREILERFRPTFSGRPFPSSRMTGARPVIHRRNHSPSSLASKRGVNETPMCHETRPDPILITEPFRLHQSGARAARPGRRRHRHATRMRAIDAPVAATRGTRPQNLSWSRPGH